MEKESRINWRETGTAADNGCRGLSLNMFDRSAEVIHLSRQILNTRSSIKSAEGQQNADLGLSS
jgi:hypothetical protein